MGLLGGSIGGIAGSGLGEYLGNRYGGETGGRIGKEIGSAGGAYLGSLLPFKKGGKVKHTGAALLHKGEIVVPAKYAKDVSKSLKQKIKKNGGHM